MAQTETVTDQGLGELGTLISGGTATGIKSIVCLDDTGVCTAAVGSTFADPAGTAVHHTGSGLLIKDATIGLDTTNTANDTITIDTVFTATATEDVVGVHICNDDNDVTIVECCFNAVIAMENTDTLTIDAEVVLDQA